MGLVCTNIGSATTHVTNIAHVLMLGLALKHVARRIRRIRLILVLRKLELHGKPPQMMRICV